MSQFVGWIVSRITQKLLNWRPSKGADNVEYLCEKKMSCRETRTIKIKEESKRENTKKN